MPPKKIAHVCLPEQLEDICCEVIDKSRMIFESLERIERYLEGAGIIPSHHSLCEPKSGPEVCRFELGKSIRIRIIQGRRSMI
ncbi:MAG: hypothetical protein K6U11_11880 [bacterium]|nr:hypothetical protein [bacterium]